MSENRLSSYWDAGGQKSVPPRDRDTQAGARCYKQGVEAMEKKEWDLASAMFAEAVRQCPDKLNFRQLFINSTCKQYGDNTIGAGSLTRQKLTEIRERVRQALADREWHLADLLCQEGLAINPWDLELHVALADAARAQGFLDVAKFSLAFARCLSRRNREINFKLMEILRQMGDHDEAHAIQTWLDDIDDEDEDGATQAVR